MYQKDFILRMIREIILLLAKVINLIKEENYEKAELVLTKIYDDYLKIDKNFFVDNEYNRILFFLKKDMDYAPDQIEVIANMLKIEGELAFKKGNKGLALNILQKSLRLYNYIEIEQINYSIERQIGITDLNYLIEQIADDS